MAFLFRLEHEDGTPADPRTFRTAVPSWRPGDVIPLGGRSLRVVDVQFEFQCECGTNGCDGRVLMTLDE
jgi:hypothetical protein